MFKDMSWFTLGLVLQVSCMSLAQATPNSPSTPALPDDSPRRTSAGMAPPSKPSQDQTETQAWQLLRTQLALKQKELHLQKPSQKAMKTMDMLNDNLRDYDPRNFYWHPRKNFDERFQSGGPYASHGIISTYHQFDPEYTRDVQEHDRFEKDEQARQKRLHDVGQLLDRADLKSGFPAMGRPQTTPRRTQSLSSLPSIRQAIEHHQVDREGRVALSLEQEHFDRERVSTAKQIIRDNPLMDQDHWRMRNDGHHDPPTERPPLHDGHAEAEAFRQRVRPVSQLDLMDKHLDSSTALAAHNEKQRHERIRAELERTQPPKVPSVQEQQALRQRTEKQTHLEGLRQDDHVLAAPTGSPQMDRELRVRKLVGDSHQKKEARCTHDRFCRKVDDIEPIPWRGHDRGDSPYVRYGGSGDFISSGYVGPPRDYYEGLRKRRPTGKAIGREAVRRGILADPTPQSTLPRSRSAPLPEKESAGGTANKKN